MTSLFRVEERPVGFAIASVANVLITIGASIALVVGGHKGAIGAVVGNFLGTLTVYIVLLGYRRYQLGFQFDRGLLRAMNRFGLPLVPSAIALWVINLIDRLFINGFKGQAEVGIYSLAVRIASVIVFLMTAFQLAWPAFAYSIREDNEARRTYGFVLTYVTFFSSWAALALGLAAPWIVRLLTTPDFYGGARVVPMLSFAFVVFGAYVVVVTSIGRVGRRGSNWIITGIAAVIGVLLNLALIPPFGMIGAAVSMLLAYFVIFLGMTWKAQRVFHVHYQWRRLATAAGTAAGLTVVGKLIDGGLPLVIVLVAIYPIVLRFVGFYLPEERARIGAFSRRLLPGRV
jgi:O-antigen/teichoic acid export membrane protein